MEQYCIKQIVVKISKEVSRLIDSLDEIYGDAGMRLTLKKEYIHKLIMTMVSPVSLKIEYDLSLFPYIIKPAKRPVPSPYSFKEEQMHQNNLQMMRNQTSQQFKTYQKKDRKKDDLPPPDYQAIPTSTREMFNPNFNHEELDHAIRQKNGGGGGIKSALSFRHEKALVAWIRSERDAGRKVNRKFVQKKAIQLSQSPDFKASWGWFRNFMLRNDEIKEMIYQYDQQMYQSNEIPSMSRSEEDQPEKMWNIPSEGDNRSQFPSSKNQMGNMESFSKLGQRMDQRVSSNMRGEQNYKIQLKKEPLQLDPKVDRKKIDQLPKFSEQKAVSKSYDHEGWNYENESGSAQDQEFANHSYFYDEESQDKGN